MSAKVQRQKMSTNELMIVLVISLGSFMAGLDATIVNIALPSIANSLDVSTVAASWVLNAYLIILVSFLLASSRLGDMKGYRFIFLGGFIVFTIGFALCGLSTSIELLVGSRMLQAVGGAAVAALGAVMVTSYLAPSLRGQALGLVAMFTMLGAALGPVLGGFLTSALSWRFIFYVNIPVGIIAVVLAAFFLPKIGPAAPKAKLDLPGVLFIFIALSALIFGLTSLLGHDKFISIAALGISVLFWLAFFLREKKAAEPLININLFRNLQFTIQNINIMLIQVTLAGVMILMPFYLELVKMLPTDNAGTILLALPIGMILTSPLSGRVSDVIGTKKPIIAGFLICSLALFLLSTLGTESGIGYVQGYLFLLGAGTGIAFAPLNSAVMGESPKKDRGAASGLIKMMTNMGSSLGVAIVMLVATAAIGPKLIQDPSHSIQSSELAGAFHISFFCLMCIALTGILLMLFIKDKKNEYSTDGEPVIPF